MQKIVSIYLLDVTLRNSNAWRSLVKKSPFFFPFLPFYLSFSSLLSSLHLSLLFHYLPFPSLPTSLSSFLLFSNRVSLHNLGGPETSYVDQAALELTEVQCLCLLSARMRGVRHDAQFLLFWDRVHTVCYLGSPCSFYLYRPSAGILSICYYAWEEITF